MINKFTHHTEVAGPAGHVTPAELVISYEIQPEDASVGMPAGIAIEAVDVLIGGQRFEFNGDFQDSALVDACWEHEQEQRERIECERAEIKREHL